MTRKEFMDKIMERLWRHGFRPRDEVSRHQVTNDFYAALNHYGAERLIAATDKIINTWTGNRNIKIAEFVNYIPPLFTPKPLPEPANSTVTPPPGYMRYLLAIQPAGSALSAVAERHKAKEGDTRKAPVLTGSYFEKLAQAIRLAKEEGAHPRTIKTLEGALYGQ